MKAKHLVYLGLGLTAGFSSCVKNNGRVEFTYNKATAVYANIEEVRNTPLTGSIRSIEDEGKLFIGESFILIGEKNQGIHVFDNSNPSNPVNVSFINLPYAEEFYVDGNIIYAESHYDLVKIDISSLSSPSLIDREENVFGEPRLDENGMALMGFNYQVTTEKFELESPEADALEEQAMLYFDYQNQLIPESEVPSSFSGTSEDSKGTLNKITKHKNNIYVVGKNKLYTFSDAAGLDFLESRHVGSELETIYPQGNQLFLGTRFSMIIMDVSNPNTPTYVSEYWHPTSCDPVLPNGSVAYLTLRTADFSGCAGDENTVEVLDISDVNNPTPLESHNLTSPYGMALVDNMLYVAEGVNGISIFDATNPASIVFESTQTNVEAYDVMEHPTNPGMIITTSDYGLEQYSVDPNTLSMTFLSSINY